jgi:hypothetical protein
MPHRLRVKEFAGIAWERRAEAGAVEKRAFGTSNASRIRDRHSPARLRERREEEPPVVIIRKNPLPPVPARHHMVKAARDLDSNALRHAERLQIDLNLSIIDS